MKKSLVLIGLVAGLIMGGCGDKKDPTKDNFEEAINKHFQNEEYSKFCVNTPKFPAKEEASKYNENQISELDSLVKVGLITSTPAQVEDNSLTGLDIFSGKRKIVAGFEYKLTDLGKKMYTEEGRYGGSFCSPIKSKVSSIENFTEPADMMGYKLVTVNYKLQQSDIPTWATNIVKENGYESYARKISTEPIDDKIELILTDNGWIPSKDLK